MHGNISTFAGPLATLQSSDMAQRLGHHVFAPRYVQIQQVDAIIGRVFSAMRGEVWTSISNKNFSGAYTPTLTNVANISSSTAYLSQWINVNGAVVVSGKANVDPIVTATSTQLGISLPFSASFAGTQGCSGTAFCPSIAGNGAAIIGDVANSRAQMQWISGTDVGAQDMYYIFLYHTLASSAIFPVDVAV